MAAQLLDGALPEPLWSQLLGVLRDRLLSGEYRERLPTEMELCEEFSVSRATVREAIRHLREEGLLRARRGSGTFVVHRQLEQGLIGAPGLSGTLRAAGLNEETKVLRLIEARADERAARRLGLDPANLVVWVERLRSADGLRVAIDRSALSLSERERKSYLSSELEQGSIYGALEERCQIQVTGAEEEVRAVRPREEAASLLSLGPEEGLFQIELVSYAGTRPVEWRISRVRGSAYVLQARWGSIPRPS